ncbi:hypothetical protein LPTSP2_23480 [Leptospira ellinghausenii]|uniref:Uncharacterized protein n=1 Tax=Leptospira ellinghausenii TaxID=1917822 RepID=A0A2P2DEK3_9LEPT|nr:hypothetical protein LPTSP2_23480 [Leptospira ellinghausenii]
MIPKANNEMLPIREDTMAADGPAKTKKDNKSLTEKIFNFESEYFLSK